MKPARKALQPTTAFEIFISFSDACNFFANKFFVNDINLVENATKIILESIANLRFVGHFISYGII